MNNITCTYYWIYIYNIGNAREIKNFKINLKNCEDFVSPPLTYIVCYVTVTRAVIRFKGLYIFSPFPY